MPTSEGAPRRNRSLEVVAHGWRQLIAAESSRQFFCIFRRLLREAIFYSPRYALGLFGRTEGVLCYVRLLLGDTSLILGQRCRGLIQQGVHGVVNRCVQRACLWGSASDAQVVECVFFCVGVRLRLLLCSCIEGLREAGVILLALP